MSADDRYEEENDRVSGDAPAGDAGDNDYKNRPGQEGGVPVVSDDAPVEEGVDPATADSDKQLEADDKEAIDESNIIEERTRHAAPKGGYAEPGDDEGLPSEDGTSAGAAQ